MQEAKSLVFSTKNNKKGRKEGWKKGRKETEHKIV
jgi:hypothetical protein